MTEGGRGNTLGSRLALAFLGVALAAVVLLAVLAAIFSSVDISTLTTGQRNDLASAFAVAAGKSYQRSGGWAATDLNLALDVASNSGVQVRPVDAPGGHQPAE